MKRIFILTIGLLWAVMLCAKIPLQTAIEKGLQRAVSYQNQVLDEKSRELENRTAQMKKYFSAGFDGSYLFKSEQMEISFPGQSMIVGAKHNYDMSLWLKQPIFTGNIVTNSIKISEIQLAIAQTQTSIEKIEIEAKIKSSYFNYHLLLNKKKSLDTLIRQLNLHLKKIRNFYREELVKKTDLLETRRKIREQEINVEALNHSIHSEKIHFETLCGVDIDTVAVDFRERGWHYHRAFKEFKKSHPVLKVLAERILMLNTQGKIVKGEYLPQIAGFAELHYGKPGIDFFKNQWGFYFQGGIRFGLKLFDWNKRKRQLTTLDYGVKKVVNQRDDFILEGEKHLKQLFDARRSIKKKMGILDHLVQLADEDARLKAGLYQEQQVSNIDYLDALTTKERYMSRKNELKMHLELIKVSINRIIGKGI
jgi:outer membrane protein TolC